MQIFWVVMILTADLSVISAPGEAPSYKPASAIVRPDLYFTNETDESGRQYWKPRLQIRCDFPTIQNDTYFYWIAWYVNDIFFKQEDPQRYASRQKANLYEYELINRNYKLDITIQCIVRVSTTETELIGNRTISQGYWMGIQIINTSVIVQQGNTASIQLLSTFPFGCYSSFSLRDPDCFLSIQLYDPYDKYECTSASISVRDSLLCGARLPGLTYTELLQGKSYTNVIINMTITTKDLTDYKDIPSRFVLKLVTGSFGVVNDIIPGNYLTDINVEVQPTSSWKGKVCSSHIDPHMRTFDGKNYENQNIGVFVLYRHQTYNQEVQMMKIICGNGPTCACAIAVRAGGDLFIINICNKPRLIDFVSCYDSILQVNQIGANKYKAFLPLGTTIVISILSDVYLNIEIYPSVTDVDRTLGLCGFLSNNEGDDFKMPSGQQTPDNTVFLLSWRIPMDNSFFSPANFKPALWDADSYLCVCPAALNTTTPPATASGNKLTPLCSASLYLSCTKKVTLPGTPYQCEVRTKRSETTITKELERLLVKQSKVTYPVFAGHSVEKRQTINYTFEEAFALCNHIFDVNCPTTAFEGSLPETTKIFKNGSLSNCAQDIVYLGDISLANVHCESYRSAVNEEIYRNSTYREENPDVVKSFLSMACISNCNFHGNCINGTCVCHASYIEEDCSVSLNVPPDVDDTFNGGLCERDSENCCGEKPIYGIHFVPGITKLKSERLQIYIDGTEVVIETIVSYIPVKNRYQGTMQVPCSARKRRSNEDRNIVKTIRYGVRVSLTNDGRNYGTPQTYYTYDSRCQVVANVTNGYTFSLINGTCFIDDECYNDGNQNPSDSCKSCKSSVDPYSWTDECSNIKLNPSSSPDNLVLIVVSVVSSVAFVVVITLVIIRNQAHLKCPGVFSATSTQTISFPKYPRNGQIITMTTHEMKRYIAKEIGKGAFGTVYKAKKTDEDNLMFAIKEIKTEKELFQKSYDREVHHGRILHPFINPIVARAESLEEGICYLMYPYMKNHELRHNIDRVNQGQILCTKESNEKIWIRCIYQIVQAVVFLHKPVASVRAPIFHRDITSRNIFLDENFNARIGDFGIAVEAKWNATKVTVTKALGTEGYHPPNMSQGIYNASYDVFSVGVVILEILTGEEAVVQKNPHYLYKTYNRLRGYKDLIKYLNERPEVNKAAIWKNVDYRDKFAKIACQAVQENEMERKKLDLLQELEHLRLDPGERYKIPKNQGRCVSCFVNPKATLSTKGQECIGNECKHFCVPCLMNQHFNPLVCPKHGKTRPAFGDHVYAVFLAGNCVNDEQQDPDGKGPSQDTNTKSAQMFVDDLQKVVQVLTAKHPFVLGASKENVRVVKPEKPGTEDKMETKLKQAFEDLSAAIKQAIENENLDPEMVRLPNSLFIFYFSGHCSKDRGLYLGSTGETLKASTDWIQEMLNKKLGVDQILVVLDCCHANSQNFTDTHGLNAVDDRGKAIIIQLSSCDANETSSGKFEGEGHGSNFTHYFCHGLLGLDTVSLEDDTVLFCNECEKRNAADTDLPCGKYHNQCLSDYGVTCYTLKNYIQGHIQQLMDSTNGHECMTQVYNSQGAKEIYLAYYNPFKWHIPIHLKGSERSKTFSLNIDIDSMDKLRQNIIKQSVETDFSSFVWEFHEIYTRTGKDSCPLIAFHRRYGSDSDNELTSLDSIYKARSCSHELEARVRDNVNAICNGPVKWSKINSTLVINSGLKKNDEDLKICQSYIQIMIQSILKVEEKLRNMEQPSSRKDLKNLITEVLRVLRFIRNFNDGSLLETEKEKVLMIYLYEEFSILALEPFKIGNS